MGKRSDFIRKEKDYYPTIDKKAALSLLPHIQGINTYIEPCYGGGHLVRLLDEHTHLKCVGFSDIQTGTDALNLTWEELNGADIILTNPSWSRHILHPLIMNLKELAPTYLLFDSDWAHTKQAIPYMEFCSDIYTIGRLNWIEGTKTTGKDNCCWYRFISDKTKTQFHTKKQ